MGVPAFYRWLHDSYPRCLRDFISDGPAAASFADADAWPPNPNGVEFDNFYIDFNQVIHLATHPSDRPVPATRADALREILRQLDRLVLAARPRRLLVVALDGVAPRAKMNQQRSRRFVAAQERGAESAAQAAMARRGAASRPTSPSTATASRRAPSSCGPACPPAPPRHRVATCGAFGKLFVVLSDAATPGEGEHKIAAIIASSAPTPTTTPTRRTSSMASTPIWS